MKLQLNLFLILQCAVLRCLTFGVSYIHSLCLTHLPFHRTSHQTHLPNMSEDTRPFLHTHSQTLTLSLFQFSLHSILTVACDIEPKEGRTLYYTILHSGPLAMGKDLSLPVLPYPGPFHTRTLFNFFRKNRSLF